MLPSKNRDIFTITFLEIRIFLYQLYKEVSNQQLMGGIYSLNEQEPTNFPPVVWVCIVVRCTTYYKTAYVECYKNIWISNVILYETLIVLLNNHWISVW